jgi:hypothetical protein
MYRALAALLLVALVCGFVGVRDVLDAMHDGTSTRDGFETLLVAAVLAGLFVAGVLRQRRSSR